MKPAKMNQHLKNVHPQHKDNKKNFERHWNALKKMKLVSVEIQSKEAKRLLKLPMS